MISIKYSVIYLEAVLKVLRKAETDLFERGFGESNKFNPIFIKHIRVNPPNLSDLRSKLQ